MSFFGINNMNPEVGLGVVGKKTVTNDPKFIFFLISPSVVVEINATAQTSFLGYSTKQGCLKLVPYGFEYSLDNLFYRVVNCTNNRHP